MCIRDRGETFKNILLNCQSVIDYDQVEIEERLVGRHDPPGIENTRSIFVLYDRYGDLILTLSIQLSQI